MMLPVKRKKIPVLLLCLVIIFLAGFLIIRPALKYLSGYLSKSEQVRGNVLIVEGWMPDYAFELAFEEFQRNKYDYIVTTGMKAYPPYYTLYTNGFLIFNTKKFVRDNNMTGQHVFEINAFSELGGENRAHFNVYLNDSLAGDFLSGKVKRNYSLNWKGNLHRIDSVMVEFNNDYWGDFGDRNLYIKELIIDHKIVIPYLKNTIFQYVKPNGIGREINDVNSNAEAARNRLIAMGMDSSRIFATPCEKVTTARTLTSALAFRSWAQKSKITITGINIISMGNHARRTWMTYNKVLGEKYSVGIVSLPDQKISKAPLRQVLNTLREALGILYYRIILIPY